MKKYLTGLIIIVIGLGVTITPLSLSLQSIQGEVPQDKSFNSNEIPNKEDPNKKKKDTIEGCVDFDPDTLNCKSKGRWVTVRIHFSNKKDITTVNFGSIRFNGELSPIKVTLETGNYDNFDCLKIKFDRASVINILLLEPTEFVEISITGKFVDGINFKGNDVIKLINF
ncbi:MAG: hypothetical protein ACFFFB_03225 [Candidatus Heimdallarchaeota archaeon]